MKTSSLILLLSCFAWALFGFDATDQQILYIRSHASQGLVQSYDDQPEFYLYDQALAVFALTHSGDKVLARRVLKILSQLQTPEGAWGFSYVKTGKTFSSAEEKPRLISGAVAWTVMATNYYDSKFQTQEFQPMSDRGLAYLDSQRKKVIYHGIESHPVRFSSKRFEASAWDQTQVFSLEHNLDAYSAFQFSPRKNPNDAKVAAEILAFVKSLWNGDRFYAGFDLSQGSPNIEENYLDTQSWGVLALADSQYFSGLKNNCERHFVAPSGLIGFTDLAIGGRKPASEEPVWTEGTLGMVLALNLAGQSECRGQKSSDFLNKISEIAAAQGGGVPYAWPTGKTDFSTSRSIAGTTWLYFAKNGFNPFRP